MDVKEMIEKIKQSIGALKSKKSSDKIISKLSIVLSRGNERSVIELPAEFLFLSSFTFEGEEIPDYLFFGRYGQVFSVVAGELDIRSITSQIPMDQVESFTLKLGCVSVDYLANYTIFTLNGDRVEDGYITQETESIDIPLSRIYDEYGSLGFYIYPFDYFSYAYITGVTLEVSVKSTLASIEVTDNPYKMMYSVGERFDPKGMVVTARFDDGTSQAITDYTYSPLVKLTRNDTTITISFGGKTTTLPIFVIGAINIDETDKRYLYFDSRQYIEASAGENLCKIDACSGVLHFSRGLLSYGGKKLPLDLSLVYDHQHRDKTDIYGMETGFPKGFRTNYHQTCVYSNGKYYYTDGSAFLHVFELAENTNKIYVDRQGTGLLLEKSGYDTKIYDEFGNYSLFDGYGRLYLIHQKYTSQSSAELTIVYDGQTEKIKSIKDGMNRTITLAYSATACSVVIGETTVLSINMDSSAELTSVNRSSSVVTETDTYSFNGALNSVTAANGEKVTFVYNGDAVIGYTSNVRQKTYSIVYEKYKTTVTEVNKDIKQVLAFNKDGFLTSTYDLKNDFANNVYCVDRETCSSYYGRIDGEGVAWDSISPDGSIFTFGTDRAETYTIRGNVTLQQETSNMMRNYSVSTFAFRIFSVKLKASGNAGNKGGKVTAVLSDGDGETLCTLGFDPSIEGFQVAARAFTVNKNRVGNSNSFYVTVSVKGATGTFEFRDAKITPTLGNVEKFCSNMNIGEGGYTYADYQTRMYVLNGGVGVKFNGESSSRQIELYPEDYLANERNVYNRKDGKFNFWYNKKRGYAVGVSSAAVQYGDGLEIIFDGNGVRNSQSEAIEFFSLTSGANDIADISSPNHDKASFPTDYSGYDCEVKNYISAGGRSDVSYGYYDENQNLCVALSDKTRTDYTYDTDGNLITQITTDIDDPTLNIRSDYSHRLVYLYDEINYIGSQTAVKAYTYDLYYDLIKVVEPNGFAVEFKYDTLGERLTQLQAKIGSETTTNDIGYHNARVSYMSENDIDVCNYGYYSNGKLKTVYVFGYQYLNITFSDDYDVVTMAYANGYTLENTYNKFGQLIYKGNLATYIYSDAETAAEAYEATSPASDKLVVSPASKLYKTIDKASGITTLYAYNAWGQYSQIVSNNGMIKMFYDYYQRQSSEHFYAVGNVDIPKTRLTYNYRDDLHYYSEVSKSVNWTDGVSLSVQKDWDNLNRVKSVVTQNETTKNGTQIDIKYLPRTVQGTGTTNFISEWKYSTKTSSALSDMRNDAVEYNVNGNITKYTVTEGSNKYIITYVYDSANRLIRENNQKLNKTYIYTYDSNGNITAKKEYNYTTANISTPTQTNTYDQDLLTSWNGSSFAYDRCNNPTTYKGATMTWTRGRLLKSYKGYTFNYDANGKRYEKVYGENKTTYVWLNGKLIQENGSNNIYYLYGSTGIIGCVINGTHYYYVKNLFGDVVALVKTGDNTIVAKYVYDALGNHKVYGANDSENTSASFVGNINPIRYRSYYWDRDIGMYYLRTRWYDPEIGRFVNMDQIEYLDPETVNGLNLFAYCLNNPVMGRVISVISSNGMSHYAINSYINIAIPSINTNFSNNSNSITPLANIVSMTNSLIFHVNDEISAWLVGDFSVSSIVQYNEAGKFYAYTNTGSSNAVGVGYNLGWFGQSIYVSDNIGIGTSVQLGNISFGGELSFKKGLSFTVGYSSGNVTTEYSLNIGWGTLFRLGVGDISEFGKQILVGLAAAGSWFLSLFI